MKKLMVFAVLFLSITSFAADADLADALLKASDRGRGGLEEGLEWTANIETTENGDTSSREFLIKAKKHDAFVEALKPAKNKGEVYLFNDRQMWFYKPSLKKPVSISARQKLTGQAANGDIASTHYARDYTPTLEKTEDINGVKHYVLFLKAKTKNLTYDQIRYWISDKTKLATKAEFLTLQGKAFKMGYLEYNNVLSVGGKNIAFVSKLTIVDAKFNQNKSIIKYTKPQLEEHPNAIFNINNVTR
ncbi:outer membrane lipoprotein-sorting protein [bacterium]|nr:outer membrane lipoprotein-sorting protein [bacterium]